MTVINHFFVTLTGLCYASGRCGLKHLFLITMVTDLVF